ncbi:MAG: hypothetical protein Q7U91_12495 [Sideroxyarcus sp.]|nr:hypothetical protein [Sideroxyarcus sp.]
MLIRWIVRLLGFNVVSILIGRFLGLADELAQINDEEDEGAQTRFWYVFVMVASSCVGFWAARWYLHSIPPGDYSMGGMIFILISIFVFFLGFSVSATLMTRVATAIKGNGRLIVALASITFLFVVLYLPMRKEAQAESRKLDEDRQAMQLAAVGEVSRQVAKLPFVAPASVPEMLDISRDGDAYRVRNNGANELFVSVALVMFHDRLVDRCWAGVAAEECMKGSADCASQTSVAIPGVPEAGAGSVNIHPMLPAGEARLFTTGHCDLRFAEGMLEYYVWNDAEKRFLFRSESALIPDYH